MSKKLSSVYPQYINESILRENKPKCKLVCTPAQHRFSLQIHEYGVRVLPVVLLKSDCEHCYFPIDAAQLQPEQPAFDSMEGEQNLRNTRRKDNEEMIDNCKEIEVVSNLINSKYMKND